MGLKNIKRDWKTTVAAIIGGALMLAGLFWPDAVDADSNAIDSITDGSQTVTAPTGLSAAAPSLAGKDVTSLITADEAGCFEVVFKVDTAAGETIKETVQVVVT